MTGYGEVRVAERDYAEGDRITYQTNSGDLRTVTVEAVWPAHSVGHPGFDGVASDGRTYWGYDDQIVSVVRRRPTT